MAMTPASGVWRPTSSTASDRLQCSAWGSVGASWRRQKVLSIRQELRVERATSTQQCTNTWVCRWRSWRSVALVVATAAIPLQADADLQQLQQVAVMIKGMNQDPWRLDPARGPRSLDLEVSHQCSALMQLLSARTGRPLCDIAADLLCQAIASQDQSQP